MKRRHLTVVLTLAIGIPQTFIAANQLSAEDNPQPAPATPQVFRASDWKSGSERTFEACKANSGEYTLWGCTRLQHAAAYQGNNPIESSCFGNPSLVCPRFEPSLVCQAASMLYEFMVRANRDIPG